MTYIKSLAPEATVNINEKKTGHKTVHTPTLQQAKKYVCVIKITPCQELEKKNSVLFV